MTENKKQKVSEIDFGRLVSIVMCNKKRIAINVLIAIIVSSAIIFCIPRYYKCEVMLAPEISSANANGGLSALASSVGLNMQGIMSQDAISPELYPDLMGSVNFRTAMFPIKVTTANGEISSSYYDYLRLNQKSPIWISLVSKVKNIFKKKTHNEPLSKLDPFRLTKTQSDIAKIIGGKIKCTVDKKTDVITISVEDQDALVCAIVADSARAKLQDAITNYRTNKARIDLDYARKLNQDAKKQYDRARQKYANYADANQDIIMESYKAMVDDLENEMQLKYNIYQQTSQQVQAAQAKLQERTPAFTILQSATVPLKPAGPKRMVFVGIVSVLTFLATVVFKYIKNNV